MKRIYEKLSIRSKLILQLHTTLLIQISIEKISCIANKDIPFERSYVSALSAVIDTSDRVTMVDYSSR